MYNLYSYEKKILKDEKEKEEKIKVKKIKKKRKKELIKLAKNYDNRMNDFILTMCQNPIILYKKDNPYNKNKQYINKNYFVFGDFKTDKERLESLEEEKKILKSFQKKREDDEKIRNITKIKNHRNLMIIQPKMRFNSRTKLENIIEIIKKKEANSNIDIYNNSLTEEIKKLKYNNVKKIKEYYNLIDKDKLNNREMKQIIKILNEKEQNEINNEYTLKNYIDWKYLGIVSENNINKKIKSKSQDNINYNNISKVIEIFGKKKKNEEKKNEFECLVKDDFKTHFKGASQYISLKDMNDNHGNFLNIIQNNIQDNYNQNIIKKRAMSALKLTTKRSMKNFLSDNINQKSTNNIIEKKHKKKRPASVITNKLQDMDLKYFMHKNQYSINDLSEEFKMKKMMMKNMMNKEINNSIMKQYISKYPLVSGANKHGMFNPKTFALQNNYISEANEKELKEKLTYLQDVIAREKRLRSKDKYKQFVKRFARSTFGFRKKEILQKLDDFKEDKKCDFVVVDGKVYQTNDMKNIANVIFTKCNYINKKSESNDNILIKNNGKLMFTSGLSVNDFEIKYNL